MSDFLSAFSKQEINIVNSVLLKLTYQTNLLNEKQFTDKPLAIDSVTSLALKFFYSYSTIVFPINEFLIAAHVRTCNM
jgi:hypothetical protein